MDDTLIKNRLRLAGVPREAFSSTLTKEGYLNVKQWAANLFAGGVGYITSNRACKTQSKAIESYNSAETLFYLLAKELVLLGHGVYCCDLVDLHNLWIKQEADDAMYSRVSEAGVLCIRNFFEPGAAILTPYEYAVLASRITRMNRDGTNLVLLGIHQTPSGEALMSDWWPISTVSYLSRKATFMMANL